MENHLCKFIVDQEQRELLFAIAFSISIVNVPVQEGVEERETSFPEFDRIFMQLDNFSIS